MLRSFATTVATPVKWPRPRLAGGAAQDVGQACDLDRGGESVRVHLLEGRREQQVDPGRGGKLGVAALVARIALEVLARAELGRVHEQAHDHEPALVGGGAHQAQMALVQRAHRGDEPDRVPGAPRGRHRGAQRRDRADGSQVHGFLHGRSSSLIDGDTRRSSR